MMAPATPTNEDNTQKIQRKFGTQYETVVRTAPLIMATAACGVAMSTVRVVPKPYPEMMRGVKLVMPPFARENERVHTQIQ